MAKGKNKTKVPSLRIRSVLENVQNVPAVVDTTHGFHPKFSKFFGFSFFAKKNCNILAVRNKLLVIKT